MKRQRFNEEQGKITDCSSWAIRVIGCREGNIDICRQLGIAEQTFYRWRAKYGGLEVSEAKRLRHLEAENSKLKRLLAEKVIDCDTLQRLLAKKW